MHVFRPPDFRAGCVRLTGDDPAMREGKKAANERVRPVGGKYTRFSGIVSMGL